MQCISSKITPTTLSSTYEHRRRPQAGTDVELASINIPAMATARKRARDADQDDDNEPNYSFSQAYKRPRATSTEQSTSSESQTSTLSDTGMDIDTPLFSSSWPSSAPLPKRTDSLHPRPQRPKPYPLQRQPSASTPRGMSPEDNDPTTPLGRMSQLSVSDVDMDLDPAPLVRAEENLPVRRGRQRSGAFVGDPTNRRFQMGYREDCDKCRARVPGHMSHFVGQ